MAAIRPGQLPLPLPLDELEARMPPGVLAAKAHVWEEELDWLQTKTLWERLDIAYRRKLALARHRRDDPDS